MAIFSHAMHQLGLMGAPRRTMLSATAFLQPECASMMRWVGIGG